MNCRVIFEDTGARCEAGITKKTTEGGEHKYVLKIRAIGGKKWNALLMEFSATNGQERQMNGDQTQTWNGK